MSYYNDPDRYLYGEPGDELPEMPRIDSMTPRECVRVLAEIDAQRARESVAQRAAKGEAR